MQNLYNTKTSTLSDGGFEASTRIELVIEVLQTFALPLGYDAVLFFNDPYGI